MPLILKPVSLGFWGPIEDIVAAVVGLGEDDIGCGSDGTFKIAKGLLLATFASEEDGLARFGVTNGRFPIARFSASFVEAVLEVCDKLENAGPLTVLWPKMLGCVEGESAFNLGFSVAFSVGLDGEVLECRSVLEMSPCEPAVEAAGVESGRVTRSKRLPP